MRRLLVTIVPAAIVCTFAIFAVFPLFRGGYIPTHDGEFSIIRIWQFSKMLQAGSLVPRWAPDLNSGYGVPLFIFYYPLPYYVASIIHRSLSLVDSFKVSMAISYLLAIAACFLWLKKIFNRRGATIGTLIFMSVPYWFVDIYVRGSIGEVMAISWFVIILAAIEYEKPSIISVSTAALIISHNINAILFLPVVILYILLRGKRLMKPVFLGLGLSAFFWIPASFEQKFVAGLSNFDFRDHFPSAAQLIIPSWGSGFSQPGWPADEMSQQVGLAVWITLLTSFVIFFREKNDQYKQLVGAALLLSFTTLFFMLDISTPIWVALRPMQFVQYPWRLLSLFIPTAGFLAGYISFRSTKVWLPVIIAGSAVLLSFPYIHPVIYAPRPDEYYLSRPQFTNGTTTVGNSFSTVWLSWQSKSPVLKLENSVNVTISDLKEQPTQYTFHASAYGEGQVKLNVSYFPGWIASLDGKERQVREQDGVISLMIPSGFHKVTISFSDTLIRRLADAVSILSLFWLIGSAILGQEYAHRHRRFSAQKRA